MLLNDIVDHINKYKNVCLSFIGSDVRNYTYADLARDVDCLSGILVRAGFRQGQFIGIYAQNSYDWIVWDIATLSMGVKLFVIPTEIKINAEDVCRYVESYALAAFVTDKEISTRYVLPINLSALMTLERAGLQLNIRNFEVKDVTDDSELTYVFSSGTTGALKGLVIDRRGAEIAISKFIEDFDVTYLDSHVMYLPFTHFQQRMIIYGALYQGVKLTFTGYTQILKAIETAKPSFLISPPALYENMYNLCKISADTYLPKFKLLSTHLRFAITGMAPISPEVVRFFQSHNISLFEAYGVMEAGFIAWNKAGSMRVGSVGKPISNIAIADDGEIIVVEKNNATKRYFTDNGEQDRRVFLDDGAIATGDIGELDEDGFLYLRGRLKDIIVTASGKKFNPQEVENMLVEIPEIKESAVIDVGGVVCCFIYGKDILTNDDKNLVKEKVKDKLRDLESYKNINEFVFACEGFTPDNGYRTRTFKINRKAIAGDYSRGRLKTC